MQTNTSLTNRKKRTLYNLTHQVATCGRIGNLIPFDYVEVAPRDTFSGKIGSLVRMEAFKRAVLQDFHVDYFYFYVPHRLVWADWESFISDGPMDDPNYDPPFVTVSELARTVWRSLFLTGNPNESVNYSAFRGRAYNLIYNEYFRDDQAPIRGPDDPPGEYGAPVNYKKDYFTVLRESVGEAQPVHYIDATSGNGSQVSARQVLEKIALQKLSMKRATYGTRYIDILRGYGVNVNYQMLQRPELVAVGRTTVNVTDVVSTADTVGETSGESLGALAGHGIAAKRLTMRRKTFPEHGTLMGVMAVRPRFMDAKVTDWFQRTRTYEDYYDPGLVPLPNVSVSNYDISRSMDSAAGPNIIGYMPWGDWYRRQGNMVHERLEAEWVGASDISRAGTTPSAIRQMDSTRFNQLFNGVTDADPHFYVSTVARLKALRDIPRTNLSVQLGMTT